MCIDLKLTKPTKRDRRRNQTSFANEVRGSGEAASDPSGDAAVSDAVQLLVRVEAALPLNGLPPSGHTQSYGVAAKGPSGTAAKAAPPPKKTSGNETISICVTHRGLAAVCFKTAAVPLANG